MTVTRIKFENFTAFKQLDIQPSPGMNVLVGANGTGKTHLMKAAYAACDVSKTQVDFAEKLVRVYLPSGRALGRLVKRQRTSTRGTVEVQRDSLKLRISFSNRASVPGSATVTGAKTWTSKPVESAYIPTKEILANGPGFRSLYAQREVHFEEIYADILDRAYRPTLRGPLGGSGTTLLEQLQKLTGGKVIIKNEEFFLRNKQGDLEFALLAEGIRKLSLLWLLIQNGTLMKGSVLFWDEPESNLNPQLLGPLVEVLLELQRMGVQIFLATHDYTVLKEIDLLKGSGDKVVFHALYRDNDTREVQYHSLSEYLQIHPNAIAETYADLYNREVKRSLRV